MIANTPPANPESPTGECAIECDTAPFDAAFRQLKGNLLECPGQVPEFFFDSLDGLGELICLEAETAGGTLKITLQPSERLLELVAAARAWDR